jgi:hypothetical protein
MECGAGRLHPPTIRDSSWWRIPTAIGLRFSVIHGTALTLPMPSERFTLDLMPQLERIHDVLERSWP